MRQHPIPILIVPIVVLVLSAASVLTGQFPSDPDLVYVRIACVERERNRPLRGLLRENLKVFEDNKLQDIVYFDQENLPLQVEIIWDSIDDTKDNAKSGALVGMTKTGDRNDEFHMKELGKAPLNDAVLQALNTLAQNGNNKKRAVVLFSLRTSPKPYALSKVRDRLKELDIQLYVASLQPRSDVSSDSDREKLRELAELSGGYAFFPSSSIELPDFSRKIVALMKNQYMVGYRSTNRATDGKWRKLKITGEYPDDKTKKLIKFNVIAKPGYYAPAANGAR